VHPHGKWGTQVRLHRDPLKSASLHFPLPFSAARPHNARYISTWLLIHFARRLQSSCVAAPSFSCFPTHFQPFFFLPHSMAALAEAAAIVIKSVHREKPPKSVNNSV